MSPKRKPRHVYALFPSREQATAAYEEVQRRGCQSEHCSVLMQRDVLADEELALSETAAREGAKKGALIAGAAGAVVAGLVAIPGGLLGLGPLVAAMFGAAWGAAFGGLLGSIAGSSDPDKALRKIEEQVRAGKTLIAVETDDPAMEEICADVFAAHGGERVE
ncbi:MAG TPA: hypothetical protein VK034_07590 [Enhygromyxa sp.]|nr:hypothetical protein [Enhygromyxa sp.]